MKNNEKVALVAVQQDGNSLESVPVGVKNYELIFGDSLATDETKILR